MTAEKIHCFQFCPFCDVCVCRTDVPLRRCTKALWDEPASTEVLVGRVCNYWQDLFARYVVIMLFFQNDCAGQLSDDNIMEAGMIDVYL